MKETFSTDAPLRFDGEPTPAPYELKFIRRNSSIVDIRAYRGSDYVVLGTIYTLGNTIHLTKGDLPQ